MNQKFPKISLKDIERISKTSSCPLKNCYLLFVMSLPKRSTLLESAESISEFEAAEQSSLRESSSPKEIPTNSDRCEKKLKWANSKICVETKNHQTVGASKRGMLWPWHMNRRQEDIRLLNDCADRSCL